MSKFLMSAACVLTATGTVLLLTKSAYCLPCLLAGLAFGVAAAVAECFAK